MQTLEAGAMGRDASGAANPQNIARGPVAAVIPIKRKPLILAPKLDLATPRAAQ